MPHINFVQSSAIALAAFVMFATEAGAQTSVTAFRCDINGATVYSEKPCANGKAVAPTQDTDAQKARNAEAVKQMKADHQTIDARIDKRASDEAKARAAERAAQAKADRMRDAAEKKATAKQAKPKRATAKPAKAKVAKPKPTKAKKSTSTSVQPRAAQKPA